MIIMHYNTGMESEKSPGKSFLVGPKSEITWLALGERYHELQSTLTYALK